MLFYLLYLSGHVGSNLLPRSVSYWLAHRLADLYCLWAARDREGVRKNLAAILGREKIPLSQVREVFRNFALYLVDFLRFGPRILQEIHRRVEWDGLDRLKTVLREGRGVVVLSAHLGNYELGGALLAQAGFPTNAIVLTHQNPRVDSFFTRQRCRMGVKGLPIRSSGQRACLEASLQALRRNEILALVGDRDFFQNGLELPFFGRSIRVPRGPAFFSLKAGSPIVPVFVIRENSGGCRIILEPPLPVPRGLDFQEAVAELTRSCLEVMARYIRQYPTQWYVFQEFWRPPPAFVR